MVDARALSRALQLLAKARARELGAAHAVAVTTVHDAAGGTVDLSLRMRSDALSVPPDLDLTWEVAGRLIELQGGELRQTMRDNALTVTLSFPVNG
jgi:hypothetical protein